MCDCSCLRVKPTSEERNSRTLLCSCLSYVKLLNKYDTANFPMLSREKKLKFLHIIMAAKMSGGATNAQHCGFTTFLYITIRSCTLLM